MPSPDAKKERYCRTIKCANCGREVVQHRPNGKYCTSKCRVEAWWMKKSLAAAVRAKPNTLGAVTVNSLPEPE